MVSSNHNYLEFCCWIQHDVFVISCYVLHPTSQPCDLLKNNKMIKPITIEDDRYLQVTRSSVLDLASAFNMLLIFSTMRWYSAKSSSHQHAYYSIKTRNKKSLTPLKTPWDSTCRHEPHFCKTTMKICLHGPQLKKRDFLWHKLWNFLSSPISCILLTFSESELASKLVYSAPI